MNESNLSMSTRFLLLSAVIVAFGAASADASAIVLYENDFNMRTSLGPIGGSTTGSYLPDELVPTTQDGVGQDSWIRRHNGTKPITVVDPTSGNQYAAFSSLTSAGQHYGYAYQKIGSSVSEGALRVSVDILAPNNWTSATSARTHIAFGGDLFHSFESGHSENMASRFGFGPVGSSTNVYFAAFNGTSAVTSTGVTGGNWYRFIADHDLHSQKYSVNVYDLGTSQPDIGGMPASDPVATFNDFAFFGNSFDAITSMGLVSIRNSTEIGFDNIVIAKHELSPHAYHVLGTEPTIYWPLNEPAGKSTAADASLPVQYNGSYVGNYTLENPGPRPSDGLFGMDPGNLAAGVVSKLNAGDPGALEYTSLNTTAGVGTETYSMQMWFKSTAEWTDCRLHYLLVRSDENTWATRREHVLVDGNNGNVGTPGTNVGKLGLYDGTVTSYGTQTLNPNEWYHLTLVRDDTAEEGAAKVKLYLNGVLEIESPNAWQGGVGNGLTVGHRPDLSENVRGGLGLHGLFDEVAVWDRALSAAEVRANFVSAVPEPSAWMLLALAFLSLAGRRRRAGARRV